MQVTSLNASSAGPGELVAAVCIVGAGAAGLYLAHRLADIHGLVVVLEAGPERPVSPAEAGFDCTFSSSIYAGANEGRAFGLGGTTSRWGGQLAAFPPSDAVRADDASCASWQHICAVGERHGGQVAATLGVAQPSSASDAASGQGDAALLDDSGLSASLSCWLPFRRRNFSWLSRATSKRSDQVRVICGAVAARWQLAQGSGERCRIAAVMALGPDGQAVQVKARHFVIAAGTIESTRIVQEINALGSGQVLPSSALLGQGLSDHLSFGAAAFAAGARTQAIRQFGPRFSGKAMHTTRFVEHTPAAAAPRYFAHVVFPTDQPGFQLARSVLQDLQAGRWPQPGWRNLSRGSLGALQLAWYRLMRSRLYIADDAPCHLQIDMEQQPDNANTVRLGQGVDHLGRPIACIDWAVRYNDQIHMQQIRAGFLACWSKLGPDLSVQPVPSGSHALSKPHDAYHPVGTCRLGGDASAVVGPDLKVHGTANLFVLSTAIFPSAGSANPTFNLLCFAEMLAHDLANEAP